MLKIHDEAEEHLKNLLVEGNENSAIRIALMGGAHGPGLGLIVEEAGENDLRFEHGTLPFIIDKKLMDYCKSITIGFRKGNEGGCGGSSGGGFLIESENSLHF
jgi:Fe-S cluster assembly iron-binding protein IscA